MASWSFLELFFFSQMKWNSSHRWATFEIKIITAFTEDHVGLKDRPEKVKCEKAFRFHSKVWLLGAGGISLPRDIHWEAVVSVKLQLLEILWGRRSVVPEIACEERKVWEEWVNWLSHVAVSIVSTDLSDNLWFPWREARDAEMWWQVGYSWEVLGRGFRARWLWKVNQV